MTCILPFICGSIVVDVHCCRCAQHALPHLSETQRLWVYVMVVHARVHVQEMYFPSFDSGN